LTKKGKDINESIKKNIEIHEVKLNRYFRNLSKAALVVRKSKAKLKSFEIRDIAIKNGAEACLIFFYSHELLMPPGDFVPAEFKNFDRKFNLQNGDWIIVTIAKDKKWAEISALAVAQKMKAYSSL
jgi:hypothetical protein